MRLLGTMDVDGDNHLRIGGVDTVQLAKQYGTPLYVLDQSNIEEQMTKMKRHFRSDRFATEVVYASKAFLNSYMCRLVAKAGLGMDAISCGDMYMAWQSGFPMSKIYLHGNAKSRAELTMALDYGVGYIIVDNSDEFVKLSQICAERQQAVTVLLRVNPGIEAHTHEYIQTATSTSKFGLSIYGQEVFDLMQQIRQDPYVSLQGIHCHIGSQIFAATSFYQAIEVMTEFLVKCRQQLGVTLRQLNLGGGFGVYYTNGDNPLSLEACLRDMIKLIEAQDERYALNLEKVIIEPGRSIVCHAGTTLYTVEGRKTTAGGIHYVFVDGGMADNPRPALYQAKYEGALANRLCSSNLAPVRVAGKCCESGDVLIKETLLPEVEVGDILAISSTGAYTYSMASNYNGLTRPGVVMVKNGKAIEVTKRQDYRDLIRHDCQCEVL